MHIHIPINKRLGCWIIILYWVLVVLDMYVYHITFNIGYLFSLLLAYIPIIGQMAIPLWVIVSIL